MADDGRPTLAGLHEQLQAVQATLASIGAEDDAQSCLAPPGARLVPALVEVRRQLRALDAAALTLQESFECSPEAASSMLPSPSPLPSTMTQSADLAGSSADLTGSTELAESAASDSVSEMDRAREEVAFLREVSRLKKVQRTGWVLRGVGGPGGAVESVADHSFGVALCASLVEGDGVDWRKATRMALVHDMAEAVVGDIAPGQGVSDAEKHAMEASAMDALINGCLRGSPRAREIEALWHEYEARETPEARAVKDCDRLEMILQADAYERDEADRNLEEFFAGVRGKIKHPQVRFV